MPATDVGILPLILSYSSYPRVIFVQSATFFSYMHSHCYLYNVGTDGLRVIIFQRDYLSFFVLGYLCKAEVV